MITWWNVVAVLTGFITSVESSGINYDWFCDECKILSRTVVLDM